MSVETKGAAANGAITKELCRVLSAEIDAALKAVAEKHGLTVVVGGGSFDQTSYRPRVDFKLLDSAPIEWNRYAGIFQLPLDAIGKRITLQGGEYVIAGLKPNASRMPVIVTRVATGKSYKFTAQAVREALAGGR